MAFVEEGELSGPKWEHANRVSRNHFVLDRTDDRAGNPLRGAWMGSLTDGGGTDKTRKEERGAARIRTGDGGFAIRCLSHLATAPKTLVF